MATTARVQMQTVLRGTAVLRRQNTADCSTVAAEAGRCSRRHPCWAGTALLTVALLLQARGSADGGTRAAHAQHC